MKVLLRVLLIVLMAVSIACGGGGGGGGNGRPTEPQAATARPWASAWGR